MKPGWKTSEFWLTLAASAVSLAFASGLLGHGVALQVAGLAATALTNAGYAVSRGTAKSSLPAG